MKRSLTLMFLIANLLTKADYWTQKADFGGMARHSAVAFSIGAKGYIGTGRNVASGITLFKDFWEYDPSMNNWTQKADFGGTARFLAAGFSIGNKGYIGTGTNGSDWKSDFWEYDPLTNTWTQKTNVPNGRSSATGFATVNKGFIGSGIQQGGAADSRVYDPIANNWILIPNPGGTKIMATGFSDGIKGYLGTGTLGGYSGLNDFWELDFNTNIWTQKANFGGATRSEACAFFICPFGYIGLGTTYIGSGTVSDFWKYDIANNIWTPVANFGNGLRELAVAFSIGSKGYVGTGFINDNNDKIDFWEYTPDSACVTGIDEHLISSLEFTISPNPANDYIIINYPLPGKEKVNLIITDFNGKKIFKTQLSTNANQSRISLKDLANGIYFAEISDGKQKAVQKFFKE